MASFPVPVEYKIVRNVQSVRTYVTELAQSNTPNAMLFTCSFLTLICFVYPGGEAPDSWTVVQHQGPVGDPQEFSTTHSFLTLICFVYPGGEAPDSWTVVQHQGPVGDPQEFSTTHSRDWTRSVRKGLRRTVEQHDPSGDQNSQTR